MKNPLRLLKRRDDEEANPLRPLLRLVGNEPEPASPTPIVQPPETANPLRPDFNSGAISDTTNLPPLSINPSGRPSRDSMMLDRGAREDDYQSQLESYKPQNESWGKTALRMGIGLIAGPGQALMPLLDRKRADTNWRNRELGQSEDISDRMARRTLMRSQAAENEAQANRVPQQQGDWAQIDSDGDGIPDQEVYQKREIGATRNVFRKALAERPPHNPLLRERKNADGSTTTLQSDDYGKTWNEAPDLGSAAPREKPGKPEKPTANFSQRASWYYKKQTEAESAAKDLRDQAGKLDTTTYAGQQLQTDLLKRAGEADKNALEYRDKGDLAATEPSAAAASQRGSVKPAKDGKYHYTPAQIRAQAEAAGMSYDEVVKKLKAHPQAVIDE